MRAIPQSHLMMLPILVFTVEAAAAVWYVDPDPVTGPRNGLSWDTAFATIQDAIDEAHADEVGQVWVAEGVYAESLTMYENADVYGGFIGWTTSKQSGGHETSLTDRDWDENETVIDGEGVRRCIVGANGVRLDGFVVRNGVAPASKSVGGGMLNETCAVTVANCVFESNAAAQGGAIYSKDGSLALDGCSFLTNEADIGGAVCCYQEVLVSARDCRFEGNSAVMDGGAILAVSGPTLAVVNCVFRENSALEYGGAVSCQQSAATLKNCSFLENVAGTAGGALDNLQSSLTAINCILWDDTPDEIANDEGGNTVAYCDVGDGSVLAGTDGNISEDPGFADAESGDLHLTWGSPCVDSANCAYAPTEDMEGVPRPSSGTGRSWQTGCDMGAYEFVPKDTDGDGMPDGWEIEHNLSPSQDSDRDLDADGDGLTNLQEYLVDAGPRNPLDPPRDVYVDDGGSDATGDGTDANPWGTIAFAMESVAPYSNYRESTVHLGPGTYPELVTVAPNVVLSGAGPGESTIRYLGARKKDAVVVEMGANSRVEHCTVSVRGAAIGTVYLVRIDNVSATLSDLILDGEHVPNSVGVLIYGEGSSGSLVELCVAKRLPSAIHAVNTGATITRDWFEDITQDAIFVRRPDNPQPGAPDLTPFLGGVGELETSGLNVFRDVTGKFINSNSPTETTAQYNDWGVYARDQIEAKVSDAVNIDFFFSEKVLISPPDLRVNLFVALLDAGTRNPIPYDASVTATTIPGLSTRYDRSSRIVQFLNAVATQDYRVTVNATDYHSHLGSVDARNDQRAYAKSFYLDPLNHTITITPSPLWLSECEIRLLQASSTDAEDAFTWTCLDESVAMVDATGNVTPMAPGGTTIRVTGSHSGASAQCEIRVAHDVNCDGETGAVDVQLIINQALSIETGEDCDLNGDGSVNAVDVQLIINEVLQVFAR